MIVFASLVDYMVINVVELSLRISNYLLQGFSSFDVYNKYGVIGLIIVGVVVVVVHVVIIIIIIIVVMQPHRLRANIKLVSWLINHPLTPILPPPPTKKVTSFNCP